MGALGYLVLMIVVARHGAGATGEGDGRGGGGHHLLLAYCCNSSSCVYDHSRDVERITC